VQRVSNEWVNQNLHYLLQSEQPRGSVVFLSFAIPRVQIISYIHGTWKQETKRLYQETTRSQNHKTTRQSRASNGIAEAWHLNICRLCLSKFLIWSPIMPSSTFEDHPCLSRNRHAWQRLQDWLVHASNCDPSAPIWPITACTDGSQRPLLWQTNVAVKIL
jgi:hypothetical protein